VHESGSLVARHALPGADDDARLILINCDDLGLCPAANDASLTALAERRATGATLIVPAAHAEQAARVAAAAGLPIGVHLTLNSEWAGAPWQPLTTGASLRGPDRRLHRTPQATIAQARIDEVRAELAAQVERAREWGVDVTHLDSHMYVLQERPDFFEAYLELAGQLQVPVRISGSALQVDHPFRRLARDRGVSCPDHLIRLHRMGSRPDVMAALDDLPPGLTEIHVHPAQDTPDLRRLVDDWPARVDDEELLRDSNFWSAVERSSALLVGYRDLRDATRAVSAAP
jgi:predicted glycoside hydrolase/deacetylase ChbG (UPF0249 family)